MITKCMLRGGRSGAGNRAQTRQNRTKSARAAAASHSPVDQLISAPSSDDACAEKMLSASSGGVGVLGIALSSSAVGANDSNCGSEFSDSGSSAFSDDVAVTTLTSNRGGQIQQQRIVTSSSSSSAARQVRLSPSEVGGGGGRLLTFMETTDDDSVLSE